MQRKAAKNTSREVSDDVDSGGKSMKDYERLLMLDPDALDEAVFQQAHIYQQVGKEFARAQSLRDEIEFDLDQLSAELDQEIRSDAIKAEEKITEKAILVEISSDPKIIKLKRELLRQKTVVAEWSILRTSFDHRRDMLKVAATLYTGDYFTRTTVGSTKDQMADRVRRGRREDVDE